MSARVLITRPQPGAARTAERLRKAGFDPVVLPLTIIKRLFFKLPSGPFDGIVVTSAQALPLQDTSALVPFLGIPVLAVGETTAQAAKERGFSSVTVGTGAVDGVIGLAAGLLKPGGRLLYLCGRVRRPELEAALSDKGILIEAVETYDAMPLSYSGHELEAHLGNMPFDAVVLMSQQAATAFGALLEDQGYEQLFDKCAIVCFSARIASVCEKLPAHQLLVTKQASEDSLMETLESLYAG